MLSEHFSHTRNSKRETCARNCDLLLLLLIEEALFATYKNTDWKRRSCCCFLLTFPHHPISVQTVLWRACLQIANLNFQTRNCFTLKSYECLQRSLSRYADGQRTWCGQWSTGGRFNMLFRTFEMLRFKATASRATIRTLLNLTQADDLIRTNLIQTDLKLNTIRPLSQLGEPVEQR